MDPMGIQLGLGVTVLAVTGLIIWFLYRRHLKKQKDRQAKLQAAITSQVNQQIAVQQATLYNQQQAANDNQQPCHRQQTTVSNNQQQIVRHSPPPAYSEPDYVNYNVIQNQSADYYQFDANQASGTGFTTSVGSPKVNTPTTPPPGLNEDFQIRSEVALYGVCTPSSSAHNSINVNSN